MKILIKLCIAGAQDPTLVGLKEMKFDLKVLRRCMLVPGEKNPETRFYKLFGFCIQVSTDGCWILPPRHEWNHLHSGEEEWELE